MTRRIRNRPEQDLQIAIADMLATGLPPAVHFAHIPNAAKRGRVEGAKFKAMGTRAGMPDLEIVHGGRVDYIEVKAGREKLSDAQTERHDALRRAGARVAVARSIQDVVECLNEWRIPHRIRAVLP